MSCSLCPEPKGIDPESQKYCLNKKNGPDGFSAFLEGNEKDEKIERNILEHVTPLTSMERSLRNTGFSL